MKPLLRTGRLDNVYTDSYGRTRHRWSRSYAGDFPFYVKDGTDICYIKTGKDFIAFGFGEALNPAYEDSAHMHPVVWNITSLDAATEARISGLLKKAVA